MIDTLGLRSALTIGLAALLGSVPFGLLIVRATTGTDVRRVGSGNIGATNVLRASGALPAALTLLLDAGKGAVAVALAGALSGDGSAAGSPHTLAGWAGLSAVAAHVFSPWLRFRGGKGVATAAGALLVLSPALASVGFVVFAVTIALSRIVSLSSIAALLAVATAAVIGPLVVSDFPRVPLAPLLGICVLILARHCANIVRLVHGQEATLGKPHGIGGERS